MPFQVIRNRFDLPPEPLFLISAGNDIIRLACAYDEGPPSVGSPAFPSVFSDFVLSATIIDSDGDPVTGPKPKHTYLWEQTSGETTGVSFLTPANQITTTIRNVVTDITAIDPPITGDTDIKIFRFWIDKGTPGQQFDDVIICGDACSTMVASMTPPAIATSPLKVDVSFPNKRTRMGSNCRYEDAEDEDFILIPSIPPTGGSASVVKGNPVPAYDIIWPLPCLEGSTIEKVVLQENQGAGWVDTTTIPGPVVEKVGVQGIIPGRTYRLRVVFSEMPENLLGVRPGLVLEDQNTTFFTVPKHALPDAISVTTTSGGVSSQTAGGEEISIENYGVVQAFLIVKHPDFTPELDDSDLTASFAPGKDSELDIENYTVIARGTIWT